MASKLSIWQDMGDRAYRPFRIVETYQTVDGYRTRMSSLCFDNYEDAKKIVLAMEARNGD